MLQAAAASTAYIRVQRNCKLHCMKHCRLQLKALHIPVKIRHANTAGLYWSTLCSHYHILQAALHKSLQRLQALHTSLPTPLIFEGLCLNCKLQLQQLQAALHKPLHTCKHCTLYCHLQSLHGYHCTICRLHVVLNTTNTVHAAFATRLLKQKDIHTYPHTHAHSMNTDRHTAITKRQKHPN